MRPLTLLRLMAWFSPGFPVGAYSYSHGIEWAVEAGDVRDRATLQGWIEVVVEQGGWNDLLFLAAAHRAVAASDGNGLAEAADLAMALAGTAERRLETEAQGAAFAKAAATGWPSGAFGLLQGLPGPAYPIAVGVAAHGLDLALVLPAYLHAFAANLVSAGVRLVPLGQSDGIRILADLEGAIGELAVRAQGATLDDLGGMGLRADIAAMRHETQHTRLFRS